jgi:hypothetical protein
MASVLRDAPFSTQKTFFTKRRAILQKETYNGQGSIHGQYVRASSEVFSAGKQKFSYTLYKRGKFMYTAMINPSFAARAERRVGKWKLILTTARPQSPAQKP